MVYRAGDSNFSFEDRPPLVLRKCGFADWDRQAFRGFIAEAVDCKITYIK